MDDNVGAARSLAFTHKLTVVGTDAAVLIRREPAVSIFISRNEIK